MRGSSSEDHQAAGDSSEVDELRNMDAPTSGREFTQMQTSLSTRHVDPDDTRLPYSQNPDLISDPLQANKIVMSSSKYCQQSSEPTQIVTRLNTSNSEGFPSQIGITGLQPQERSEHSVGSHMNEYKITRSSDRTIPIHIARSQGDTLQQASDGMQRELVTDPAAESTQPNVAASCSFADNLVFVTYSLTNSDKDSTPISKFHWSPPISIEQSNKRFLEEGQQAPVKKRKVGGGRPRKADEDLKRPRAKPRDLKLSVRNPVNAAVPQDAWNIIFLYTEFGTLKNMRFVCKDFWVGLSSCGFWKNYLDLHAVPSGFRDLPMPKIPDHLSYFQFADLLMGQGCMSCPAMKTQKVQWAFCKRLCKMCFSRETITGHDSQGVTHAHGPLLDCIPAADIDMWKNYSRVAISVNASPNVSSRRGTEIKYCAVLKKDLTNILDEHTQFLASLPSDMDKEKRSNHITDWMVLKIAQNQAYLKAANACQEFARARQAHLDREYREQKQDFKYQRQKFFEEKALNLDPPMDKCTLVKIPGYLKSLEVRRPPTQRSWNEIHRRVVLYREAAEHEVRKASSEVPDLRPVPQTVASEQAQEILLELAEDVMNEYDGPSVAAEDFTYLVLREVWERYNARSDRPLHSNEDIVKPETGDRYRLCMDDAKNIYQHKICKRVENWPEPEDKRKALTFYCPGCTRTDYRKKFGFQGLMDHIRHAHCQDLSSPFRFLTQYERAGKPHFPYFQLRSVPWPKNLPICAPHHKATGRWDPHKEDYERAPAQEDGPPSAFVGREVRPRTSKAPASKGTAAGHMIDSIREASRMLQNSPLTAPCKARVAWSYAIGSKEQSFNAYPLMASDLDRISNELIRSGDFGILSRVGCKACVEPKLLRQHKHAEMKHSFESIINHYRLEHGRQLPPGTLETDLLNLPTGCEVARELEKPGMEEAREAFEYFFPSSSSSSSSTRQAMQNLQEALDIKTKPSEKKPQAALEMLAEQAAKIDPRLRALSGQISGPQIAGHQKSITEAGVSRGFGINDILSSADDSSNGEPSASSAGISISRSRYRRSTVAPVSALLNSSP